MYRLSGVLILFFVGFLGHFQIGLAQGSALQQGATAPSASVNSDSNQGPIEKAPQPQTPSPLVIGPGDELEITVYGAPDLSEHTRVSVGGTISMPLVGSVHVGGLTSSEAEGAIENQLRQNHILNDPQVSLFVKEYSSSEISVAGV